MFIRKQEDHKVDANAYNVNYSMTRERPKVALLEPVRTKRRLMQSVNIDSMSSLESKVQQTPVELKKLAKRFNKLSSTKKFKGEVSDTGNTESRSVSKTAGQSKLKFEEDGEIVYEGNLGNVD